MKKKVLAGSFLSVCLYAQDFLGFQAEALQKSPYLQANALHVQQVQQEAQMITRYKNPTLSLEVSNFELDGGSDENGFGISLAQPVRLWGVSQRKNDLAEAKVTEGKQYVTMQRAEFIRELSMLYLEYKRRVLLHRLTEETRKLSQKIYEISKERFEAGTISKVQYIQAKVDLQRAQNMLKKMEMSIFEARNALEVLSGITSKEVLSVNYAFAQTLEEREAAKVLYMRAKEQRALREAENFANKIEWVEIYAAFEQEPDQNIIRAGVDIPLAVFNDRTQEKELSKLQARSFAYTTTLEQTRSGVEKEQALEMIRRLDEIAETTQSLIATQQELLSMYEDGYKIAKIDLLELQIVKNRLIRSKMERIELQIQKEKNIVQYNYSAGAYNE